MNTAAPPFDNVKVRQAANYAIDREALVKILGGDLQGTPSSGILSDTMLPEGYPAEVYPPTPDVEKAKALLQEAGIKTPLDAGTMYYPEAGVNADIAQQVVSDLKNVGLNMKLKGLNTDNYYQFIQNPENKDAIAMAAWEADYPDGITLLRAAARLRRRRRRVELRRLQGPGVRRRGGDASTRCRPARSAARRRATSPTSLADQAPWISSSPATTST